MCIRDSNTIIAESEISHSGLQKNLYFKDWLDSRTEGAQNIEILNLDLTEALNPWAREVSSREKLIQYAINKYPNAKFILSDLDEIPSNSQVKKFLDSEGNYNFVSPTYFRFANWKTQDDEHINWRKGIFGDKSLLELPNGGRNFEFPILLDCDSGIHFSYGTKIRGSISGKIQNFAHQELNFDELTSSRTHEFADRFQIDHLGRFRVRSRGILKFEDKQELNEVQKKLHDAHPEFFNFSRIKINIFRRLIASMILTYLIEVPCRRKLVFEMYINKSRGNFMSRFVGVAFMCSYFAKIYFVNKITKLISSFRDRFTL